MRSRVARCRAVRRFVSACLRELGARGRRRISRGVLSVFQPGTDDSAPRRADDRAVFRFVAARSVAGAGGRSRVAACRAFTAGALHGHWLLPITSTQSRIKRADECRQMRRGRVTSGRRCIRSAQQFDLNQHVRRLERAIILAETCRKPQSRLEHSQLAAAVRLVRSRAQSDFAEPPDGPAGSAAVTWWSMCCITRCCT